MSSNPAFDQATAVARQAGAAAAELGDEQLAGSVRELRRLADVAAAAYAATLRVFDARGVSETREVLTTKQWARHHLNVASGETGQMLRVAKVVAKLPVVDAALAAGEIRWPHAAMIADLSALLGVEAIAECQQSLVDAAGLNDPARFRAALRAKGMDVDSKSARKRARKEQEGRWLDVAATFRGTVSIDGMLDPETGAIVVAAIEAAAKPAGAGDTRTAAQRRADALVDICRGLTHDSLPGDSTNEASNQPAPNDTTASDATTHDSDDTNATTAGNATPDAASAYPDANTSDDMGAHNAASNAARPNASAGRSGCRCGGRGARPSLVVVCDFDTLLDVTGGFGELPNGHTVPGDTVRRLACDASITRVVVGPNSQPLDVGRSQRTVTTAQLKALRVRDNGCRFPGCDRPFEWTDAHHIHWWTNGGTTDIANLIMLCRKHHTTVHEGGWTVHARPDGEFRFTDPAGVTVADTTARTTRDLVAQLIRSEAAHQP